MLKVRSITLQGPVLPPMCPGDQAVHSSDFGAEKGYGVYRDVSTSEYHIVKESKDGKFAEGAKVKSIPFGYVKCVEYFDLEHSPLYMSVKVREDTAEEAEVKRGPGRPRIHPLPTNP
jgi:hypothetical protein